MKKPNVQLLLTGNEIISGDVIDSNSAMIAQDLKELGIEVERKVTVADNINALVEEIKAISKVADILIINGGLGPTVDDMTSQALALAANDPIKRNKLAMAHLKKWCLKRNFELSEPNKKQADLPQSCEIIANSTGSAVGIKLTLNDCDIYCTPGVPSELKVMLRNEIIPLLAGQIPEQFKTHVYRMQVFGLGESSLQKMIIEQFPHWPTEVELGFRAALPLLEVKLTSRSTEGLTLSTQWKHQLEKLLGDHIIGENSVKLPQQVVNLLSTKHQKITLAESCTGGLIASLLTQVSGASKVFEAGFVTYSDQMKTKLLAVSEETLVKYGAVSEQTVIEMAKGALTLSNADYAIAVSGIAGPDGGSTDKPVGTVWIAWGSSKKILTTCLYLPGSRRYFQQYVAAICLDLIRRKLINSTQKPDYLETRKSIIKI